MIGKYIVQEVFSSFKNYIFVLYIDILSSRAQGIDIVQLYNLENTFVLPAITVRSL